VGINLHIEESEFNKHSCGPYRVAERTMYYGLYMTAILVTYHLSKSALMATQGAGTGVSAGAAVSESDMVYGVGVNA